MGRGGIATSIHSKPFLPFLGGATMAFDKMYGSNAIMSVMLIPTNQQSMKNSR